MKKANKLKGAFPTGLNMLTTKSFSLLLILIAIAPIVRSSAADAPDREEADKKALEPMKSYVGQWKGGSRGGGEMREGWVEDADWSWEFKNGRAVLVFSSPKGKFFSAGKLEPGEKPATYHFVGTLPDGKEQQEFDGAIEKTELVLTSAKPPEGQPGKLSIELLAKGARLVMYYQKKSGERFTPLAEVGFTRKGSDFGKDSNARECIITGGVGTIPVTYKGTTYYVCCGGCKSTFLDNPEKELAAYKKRKEEEKLPKKD